MSTFTQKNEVSAEQIVVTDEQKKILQNSGVAGQVKVAEAEGENGTDVYFVVRVINGNATRVNEGDYIVTDKSGAQAIFSKKDFEATHESVVEPAPEEPAAPAKGNAKA